MLVVLTGRGMESNLVGRHVQREEEEGEEKGRRDGCLCICKP